MTVKIYLSGSSSGEGPAKDHTPAAAQQSALGGAGGGKGQAAVVTPKAAAAGGADVPYSSSGGGVGAAAVPNGINNNTPAGAAAAGVDINGNITTPAVNGDCSIAQPNANTNPTTGAPVTAPNGGAPVDHKASSPPTAITASIPVAQPNPTPTPIPAPLGQQMSQLPPAGKLEARLRALELMARRVGRAQQTIVKGVPTDLPTHVVRPLRVGPPPSMARIMAAGGPGILGPARTPGAPGSHRLSRPGGVGLSPFHRRRSLDEEESEEEEEEDRSEDDGDADEDGGQEGEDNLKTRRDEGGGGGRGGSGGQVPSSSGSSDDDEGCTASDEGEAVVSPRSPSFPRGGKVKPAAAGAGAGAATLGNGDYDSGGGGGVHTGSMAMMENGDYPEAESPMVTGIRPTVPPSPFMNTAPSTEQNITGNTSKSAGFDLKELSGMHGGGDMHAAVDSVANMLSLPRNQSTGMLLVEMQSVSEAPEGDGDFMQLT